MTDKKDKEFRKLSIDSFFNFEADTIDISLNQVKIIHNSGDIPASGDEFEIAIRNFFKNKLPVKFYISNGHIIDKSLNTSPQLDLIIADNFRTPILYRTSNETEYLTFESIYTYSEIKSSWNKKYIQEFVTTKERIHSFLVREDVSPNFIDTGGKGIILNKATTNFAYKNPLFSTLIIGNSDAFSFNHITEVYNSTNWKFLPNILCLYDQGLIINIKKNLLDDGIFKVNLYPEFLDNNEDNEWILLTYDKKRSVLGTLYYMILEHLNTCILGSPNMLDYMQNIFEIKTDNIEFIKQN